VRLVGIGDSITAGLGAASRDHTFFNRLLQNPADEFPDMQGRCMERIATAKRAALGLWNDSGAPSAARRPPQQRRDRMEQLSSVNGFRQMHVASGV
jgi:hypothetical protein